MWNSYKSAVCLRLLIAKLEKGSQLKHLKTCHFRQWQFHGYNNLKEEFQYSELIPTIYSAGVVLWDHSYWRHKISSNSVPLNPMTKQTLGEAQSRTPWLTFCIPTDWRMFSFLFLWKVSKSQSWAVSEEVVMAYLPDACTEMEHTDDSCPLIQLTSSLVTVVRVRLLRVKHHSLINKHYT